jgi:predicted  nucleic acid-binding Zn-ribbon protein
MSGSDPFFKIRPTKRSNPEARTTLDTIHHAHLNKLVEESESVDDIEQQFRELKERMRVCNDDIEKVKLDKEYQDLLKEYKKRKSGSAVYDYFLETGNILYQYYDIQDKISRGVESKSNRAVKSKPGSIWAVLQNAAAVEEEENDSNVLTATVPSVVSGEDMRRDRLLERFLQKIDPSHARSSQNIDDPYGECDECDCEMFFSSNEALFTCPQCGFQEFVLVDSDKPSYKDPPREVSYYAYKRINHFNEWLAQIQAKESTDIPQEVFDAIFAELKKERITDIGNIKTSKIREILKKLKFNKYYEHAAHIMNRINGKNAPVITRETEEKLRHMFIEIQPSFQKHCPAGRSNFLSYSYVLYKFCELLELDEYLPNFPILKNRDKLFCQDKIWQEICKDLRWQFIRSV